MQTRFYIPEDTPTLAYAQEYLLRRGMPIVSEGRYASHVLLGMAPKALPEGIPGGCGGDGWKIGYSRRGAEN